MCFTQSCEVDAQGKLQGLTEERAVIPTLALLGAPVQNSVFLPMKMRELC